MEEWAGRDVIGLDITTGKWIDSNQYEKFMNKCEIKEIERPV